MADDEYVKVERSLGEKLAITQIGISCGNAVISLGDVSHARQALAMAIVHFMVRCVDESDAHLSLEEVMLAMREISHNVEHNYETQLREYTGATVN